MDIENKKSIYGKKTGTKETYTGLEPLPETTIPVVDKDNLKGLSEKETGHYRKLFERKEYCADF